MNVLDIAILVIAGICFLVGFKKGIIKQVFSTCTWLVALVLAYFLCTPLFNYAKTETIGSFQPYTYVEEKVTPFIEGKLGDYAQIELTPDNADEVINNAIEQMGLPTFLNNFITKLLVNDEFKASASGTLSGYIVPSVSNFILKALCFLVIFLVGIILLKVVGFFICKLIAGVGLGLVDRLAGAVLGLAFSLIIINVAMFVLSFLVGVVPAVEGFVSGELAKESIGLAKYFYDKNWISVLLSNGFNFAELLNIIKEDVSAIA